MASKQTIDKLQKDLVNVQRDIKSTLAQYKSADGDRKQRYVEELKKLQEKRKKLDAALEAAIGQLHSDAELEDVNERKGVRSRLTKLIERLVKTELKKRKLNESPVPFNLADVFYFKKF